MKRQWQLPPEYGRFLLRIIAKVLLYNTIISLFLTIVVTGTTFTYSFIYSQSIGLGIALPMILSSLIRGKSGPGWQDTLVGVIIGAPAGFAIGTWANGMSVSQLTQDNPYHVSVSFAAALIFGAFSVFYFYLEDRFRAQKAAQQSERIKRLEYENALSQSELRLLQAQIEPHFLFNTLSNVVSLTGTDPDKANNMLYNLIFLLRASLERTRSTSYMLFEEIAILQAYLGIMEVRMGPCLRWSVEVGDDVGNAIVPPLLIQPLVENSIRHGLEPTAKGGQVTIRCKAVDGLLEITVEDDGIGMTAASHKGTGLENITSRLELFFGRGSTTIEIVQPNTKGLMVRLRMPINIHSGDIAMTSPPASASK